MGCGSSRGIVTAAAAAVDVADIEPTAAAVSRGMQCAEVARAQPPARVAVAARSFAECGLVDVSLSTLSQLTTAQRLSFAGPTETSNWLVPGRVLVGSCPGTHCYTTAGDEGTRLGSSRETVLAELTLLRDAGVTAFFNFQQRSEEKHCRPYYANLLQQVYGELNARAKHPNVHRFPTADGNVWPTPAMHTIVNTIEAALREDPPQVLYLHCYGGHGRAGTVAAILLYRLYNISAEDALLIVQRNHECRRAAGERSNRSP